MRCVAYVRLSREDERIAGGIEAQLAARAAQCQEIALRHHITIDEVISEQGSGSTIAGRPGMLRLLALCRRREVSVIVTPEQSRLLRGDKRDEAEIEEVFIAAAVALITAEGVTEFGSAEYDPLLVEVAAALGRHELRNFAKRKVRANQVRFTEGKRWAGRAPYGYKLDAGEPCGYRLVPTEYAIVEEIMERMGRCESINSIVQDLTARRIPPPLAHGEPKPWHHRTIRSMVLNPFYAGRHGRVMVRVGKSWQERRPQDIEIAPTEGSWTHPITLGQWQEFVLQMGDRARPIVRSGLLTGLAWCEGGTYYHRTGGQYVCQCRPKHTVVVAKLDALAVRVMAATLDALPATALGKGRRVDRDAALAGMAQAQADVRAARKQADDMMRREQYYVSLFGRSHYEATAKRTADQLAAATARAEKLAQVIALPNADELRPLVTRIRRVGFDAVWQALDLQERRLMLTAVIERIDVAPKRRNRGVNHTRATATLHPWAAAYAPDLPTNL